MSMRCPCTWSTTYHFGLRYLTIKRSSPQELESDRTGSSVALVAKGEAMPRALWDSQGMGVFLSARYPYLRPHEKLEGLRPHETLEGGAARWRYPYTDGRG